MSARARVIALGQEAAGDDGVGLVVLARLRARGVPDGVALHHALEASDLVFLLETPAPVVLVDAVLARPAGEVVALRLEALEDRGLVSASSHGLGVGACVALARVLAPQDVSPAIHVVGITITRPQPYRRGLSAEVEAAVTPAVERVLSLLAG